jgi:hypothetical protein
LSLAPNLTSVADLLGVDVPTVRTRPWGNTLLAGRDFRRTDKLTSPKVCVVNEAFAKKYFGGINAVGHKIGVGIDPGTKTDITIVGVSRNTKL